MYVLFLKKRCSNLALRTVKRAENLETGVAVIDVIDADHVRVTIRIFNERASPWLLSEKVSKICDSVVRAGSDDCGGGGATVPRFTRLVLAIRSWNQRSLGSFRRLAADCV